MMTTHAHDAMNSAAARSSATIAAVDPVVGAPPHVVDSVYRAVLHLHSERSSWWKYGPMRKFGVPECYVPVVDRVGEHCGEVDGIFLTDHDVPFVLDEEGYRRLSERRAALGQSLDVGCGEEVTVEQPPRPGQAMASGLEVLVLYRGLHPYFDRQRILAAHEQVHRHTGDVEDFFRFLGSRDDLVEIVAHPFAGLFRLDAETYRRLLGEGLIRRFEVFCGGEVTLRQNFYARQVADVWRLGVTASDDSHAPTRGPRNHTSAVAGSMDEFVDRLAAGDTVATAEHRPVFPRKVREVVGGFYGGYLSWALRNLSRHLRQDSSMVFMQRVVGSTLGLPTCAVVAPLQVAVYLARSELASRRTFARLATLEPRLDANDAAFVAWRRRVLSRPRS